MGELVQRLRRVLGEYDDLPLGICVDKLGDRAAGGFIGVGAELAFEAAAPVHARIPGREAVDCFADGLKRRGAGRVVQIGVTE